MTNARTGLLCASVLFAAGCLDYSSVPDARDGGSSDGSVYPDASPLDGATQHDSAGAADLADGPDAGTSGITLIGSVEIVMQSGASHVVTVPSSVNKGDRAVVLAWTSGTDGLTFSPAFTDDVDTGVAAVRAYEFSRVLDGTEGGNLTIDGGGDVYFASVRFYRGVTSIVVTSTTTSSTDVDAIFQAGTGPTVELAILAQKRRPLFVADERRALHDHVGSPVLRCQQRRVRG